MNSRSIRLSFLSMYYLRLIIESVRRKTGFLWLFLFASCSVSGSTFYIYFENTGDEDIYYTYAERDFNFMGPTDNWDAVGWYKLAAGAYKKAYVSERSARVTFAFAKRDGYIQYSFSRGPLSPAIDGWHVHANEAFDYSFYKESSASAARPDYVKASFSYSLSEYSFTARDVQIQKVKIPSYKTDQVTPFNSTPKVDALLEELKARQQNGEFTLSRFQPKPSPPPAEPPQASPQVASDDASAPEGKLNETTVILLSYLPFLIGYLAGIFALSKRWRISFLPVSLAKYLYFIIAFLLLWAAIAFGGDFTSIPSSMNIIVSGALAAIVYLAHHLLVFPFALAFPGILGCQSRKSVCKLIFWFCLVTLLVFAVFFFIGHSGHV